MDNGDPDIDDFSLVYRQRDPIQEEERHASGRREVLTARGGDKPIFYPPLSDSPPSGVYFDTYNHGDPEISAEPIDDGVHHGYRAKVKRPSESSGSDEMENEFDSCGSFQALATNSCKDDKRRVLRYDSSGQTEEHSNYMHTLEFGPPDLEGAAGNGSNSMAISDKPYEYKVDEKYTGNNSIDNHSTENVGNNPTHGGIVDSVRAETNSMEENSEETYPSISAAPGVVRPSEPVTCQEYRDISRRIASLQTFPRPGRLIDLMAEAGLFRPDDQGADDDTVYCYRCGNCLSHFDDHDDPQVEHDKFFPECKDTHWY